METIESNKRGWRLGWIVALAGIGVVGIWLLSTTAAAQNDDTADLTAGTGDVLARIGDIEIQRSEVEEAVAKELRDLSRQRHELLEKGLEAVVNDKLVEIAAEAKGMTADAFLTAEVDAKIPAVTDEELDKFYEQRKGQIKQPKESVAGQIRQYLEQTRKQEAFGKLVSSLRAEHELEILLDPLRIEVAEAGAPSFGPESAPVTIIEFSDFQCPFCSRVIPTFDRVKQEYADSVRLVFRQFPLHSIHPQAQKAAEASLCADDQGKFWEMHDAMFENQSALAVEDLKSVAQRLELDAAVFDECLDSGKHADRVTADLQAGVAAGVTGTPAMFINGRFLSGAQPYDAIAKVIDDELRRTGS